jgi:hypothetical protein
VSIQDLEITDEMLESLKMEDIYRIAQRMPEVKGADGKVITAQDRIKIFMKRAQSNR